MQAIILQCPERARFHFGNIALDENTSLDDTAVYPHSDTLFSAIINTANLLAPDLVDDLIDAFESGLVKHSSAFFCLENRGDWIYFLPKPMHTNLWAPPEGVSYKRMAKIAFLSKAVWETGLTPDEWFDTQHCRVLAERFVVTVAEADRLPVAFDDPRKGAIYKVLTLPKVRVHTTDSSGGYFHQTSVQLLQHRADSEGRFAKTHYYLLLEHQLTGDLAELFQGILDVLPDQGIGGERTVGCGRLLGVKREEFSWELPTDTAHNVALSLLNPRSTETNAIHIYKTITRGGRRVAGFGAETYLNRVRMLQEGALVDKGVKGRLVAIGPDEAPDRFIRAGRHFAAPLHTALALEKIDQYDR